MKKKIEGTVELYKDSLSPTERKQYDEEFRELLMSELLLAMLENDEEVISRIAKKANIPSATIDEIRTSLANLHVKNLFKNIQNLGFAIFAEKDGERIALSTIS